MRRRRRTQELGCDATQLDSELGCDATATDIVLGRGQQFPEDAAPGPIYVCTRNDALEGIVERTPPERREDLVFLQNGMLGDFLESKGLADNTQARSLRSRRRRLRSHRSCRRLRSRGRLRSLCSQRGRRPP